MLRSTPVALVSLFAVGLEADPQTWSWLVLALLGACAVAAWVAVARLGEIERRLASLARNDESAAPGAPSRVAREGLDLSRIEQVLTEIREGSKRLEDALLRSIAAGRPASAALESLGTQGVDLAERVTNRMLALGYERIVVITPREQFETIFEGGGEVQVEARRDGAPCKGKAVFRGGALVDIAMQSAYATFP